MAIFHVNIPIATGIASLAAIVFIVARARQRERQFTLFDSMILVILMAIATAGGVTLLEAASAGARDLSLRENLRTFRTQIEAYRLQHGGAAPVLFQGEFPQLTEPTNAQGIPGRADPKHPYGPYFRLGIPANPLTGKSVVTAIDAFPPKRASGNGGWLYHQETGNIAADCAEHLAE